MKAVKIDQKDRLLLTLLQRDARMPVSQLARSVHLARSSVQARIKRLEESGIIKSYNLEIDTTLLDQPAVNARVAVTAKATAQNKLIEIFSTIPQITCCESVSGASDLHLHLATQSTAQLEVVLDKINQLAGVEHTESSIVLRRFFDRDPC